ncbi:MAG: dephospho-CoA kinase [Ginsengibacter sp.]
MLRIGLTGGLGSGKSTVAAIFEVLNIPVYYSDDASKRLLNENAGIKASVIKAFGPASYPEGNPDRKYLASVVFNDEKCLKILNSILHPATLADAEDWIKKQTAPYAIKEAALIFESGSHQSLDYVIGVKAPLPLRLKRVQQRDSTDEKDALARMNHQMDEEKKLELCDFIVVNDEQRLLIPQVLSLHQQLLQLAGES